MTDLSELTAAFWRVMPADPDPVETREWLDAFNSLIESNGRERATYLLRKLLDEARAKRVPAIRLRLPNNRSSPATSTSRRGSRHWCAGTRWQWWCAPIAEPPN
jgi:pyruvate dehydrogenase complex dehydrogenase (E1) component